MPKQVSDIVIPNAEVLYANVGTAIPADTVAVGGAWPAGWTSVGFLKEAVKVTYEYDILDVMVLQHLAPVKRRKTKEGLKIEILLSELTANGLQLAFDGTVTQTAAGAGQPGKEELALGGVATITERAWGIEGSYIDEDGASFPIRIFVWKATAEAGGDSEWGKEDYTGTPLKLAALVDTTKAAGQNLWKWQKILEPAV